MPKVLFYAGTAFCLFLALTTAAELGREVETGAVSFIALHGGTGPVAPHAAWAILVAFIAGLTTAAIFLRMAALLAARNLFAAFFAVFAVTGAVGALAAVLALQARLVVLRSASLTLQELHFVAATALAYFVALSLIALRPYFRIQASRFLSALVTFPLPLFALMLAQYVFLGGTATTFLPGDVAAYRVFLAVMSVLFFAIAIHCIRHRYLFLEMTNLRELLDPRVDPTGRGVRVSGMAFDG